MPLTTRIAVSSFDDMLTSVEMNAPDAESVLVSWSRSHQSCAVMGLLDDDGDPLDVTADMLARLTGLLARPVTVEALEWAFPDADLSGPIILRVHANVMVSGLFAENVLDHVLNQLPVGDAEIRDALWLLLDSVALPTGAVGVHRIVLTPEFPEDAVFEPVLFLEMPDGSGVSVSWADAQERFSGFVQVASAVASLANELAVRAERALSLSDRPTVLTETVVPLR